MRASAVGAVVAVVILAGLVGAAVASAAGSLNRYTATVSDRQTAPGSARSPVALGLTEKITIVPAANVNPDPLTGLDLSLADVRYDATGFPVCRAASITAAGEDSRCPPRALVATGEISGEVWSPQQPSVGGLLCEAVLDVWNGGGGTLVYFPRVLAGHFCGGLQTGEIPAWTGTLRRSGSTLEIDTPLPEVDSTDLGGTGLYSGLTSLVLTFSRQTRTVGHRTVPLLGSTGCRGAGRAYRLSLQAAGLGATQLVELGGSAGC